jgi:D-inositol-3-phosphate glycosyltransferase
MNVFVRELGAALAQAGVTVRVYVRRWADGLDPLVTVEPGFEVIHIPAGPPDIPKSDLLGVVEEFAAGVRRDIHSRGDTSVLHANYWLSGVAGHRIKHDLDLPLVSTFHTLARVKADSGDPEPQRRVDAESEVIACSDLITASNPVEARQLVEHYGAAPERIELVPPGVDHAFFSPGDRRGARRALGWDDRPVLLFVGRIQPLKGLTVAVDALAMLARARQRIESLGLAHQVTFVAPRPHHLLSTHYRAADVVVVPSRSESFGLVALEAAACGVPVVASAVGGLTTLVEDGVTGFLVPERDPALFADRIAKLLDDPMTAAEMSIEAATRARRYTWSTTAGRLRRAYADLASRVTLERCGA